MKLKLLLAFVAASLVACSSDDSTPVNPVAEKDLKEVLTTYDGQQAELLKFENNRITERYLLNNGQPFYEDFYTYDDEGRMIARSVYNTAGDGAETTIAYDETGRINYIYTQYVYEGSPGNTEERSFDYSIPNKVIETVMTENQSNSTSTYDLDSNGRVYKWTGQGTNPNIYEATYNGNNLASLNYTLYYTSGYETTTSNFTYDMVTEVKGEYLNIETNRFGDHIANTALYNKTISNLKSNYILQAENENTVNTHAYQFDTDGFPINVKVYDGEALFRNIDIIYQ